METQGWATAAYGRACAGCAQAKCKCLVTEEGDRCARCRRLNRECRPATRTRKMNPLRRSAAAKTAQLERRLDELTSLLQGSARANNAVAATPDSPLSDSGLSRGTQTSGPSQQSTKPSSPRSSSIDNRSRAPTSRIAEDDEVLTSFRARLRYFPFIHLAPPYCAADIKADSPYLWRCMVLLHCKDVQRRNDLHTELKEVLAKALLADCKRSFDLLQTVLVYLAWIGFECQPRKVSLGPYMQMATSLILDIGLNRPPPQAADNTGAQFIKVGPGPCRPWVSLARTMDERRAVLACFVTCSTISQTLSRTDYLRWTPHMTECLDVLAQTKATPDDAVLVQIVRAQRVVDKVIKGLGNVFDGVDEGYNTGGPLSFYLKGLQSEVDDIRAKMPPELHQNTIVLAHLSYAEIAIYEIAVAKSLPPNQGLDLIHLDHLYACLSAIRQRFEMFLSFPVVAFVYLPLTTLMHTAHSMVALFRLSTFEYPGWDLVVVRQTADLLLLTRQVADKYFQVAEMLGVQNEDMEESDSYTTTAKILMGLQAGWATRLPNVQPITLPTADVPPLPEIDQELVNSWLASQDFSWFTDLSVQRGPS
ncbi:hypothetical protein BJY01DRAFT_723 [Aspergillus pseudoustus]|uniref:Zn(2)-C6 fungal-type domain-containing protein n=1 Tax=Aspergillus pseudoustus TaxID=1810923 RepID=A0ABR4L243_9EURO